MSLKRNSALIITITSVRSSSFSPSSVDRRVKVREKGNSGKWQPPIHNSILFSYSYTIDSHYVILYSKLNYSISKLVNCLTACGVATSTAFSAANSGIVDVTFPILSTSCTIGIVAPLPTTEVYVTCTGTIPGITPIVCLSVLLYTSFHRPTRMYMICATIEFLLEGILNWKTLRVQFMSLMV